jgi:hypothetical protein
MDMIDDFAQLITAIEARGRFTSFRPDIEGGQLVCVSDCDAQGRLYGNSFLLLRKGGQWVVSTWGGGNEYFVPSDQNIVDLCIECLEASNRPIAEIPDAIVKKYCLFKGDTKNQGI